MIFLFRLIVISLVTSSIETIPDLSFYTRFDLRFVDAIIIVIFSIEYLLRLFLADKALRYLFGFFCIVDLLAILPFYVTTGIDL